MDWWHGLRLSLWLPSAADVPHAATTVLQIATYDSCQLSSLLVIFLPPLIFTCTTTSNEIIKSYCQVCLQCFHFSFFLLGMWSYLKSGKKKKGSHGKVIPVQSTKQLLKLLQEQNNLVTTALGRGSRSWQNNAETLRVLGTLLMNN